MICGNCGAEIDDKLTACPYCGAMQYETSEEKYMKDLYNLNDGMEKLDKNARKYIIKSTLKSAGIICAAIAAAVLAGTITGYGSYKSSYDSFSSRKEIHQSFDWYNNNINKLNSLYEQGDYDSVVKLTDSYKGKSDVLAKWKHYSFINIYDRYYSRFSDCYNMTKSKEKLIDYQFASGFRASLDLIHFVNDKNGYEYRKYENCTEEEKRKVDSWTTEAQDYLKNVAKATDKEINDMLNELYQDGYYDYKLGKNYEESFYKKYSEGGNN